MSQQGMRTFSTEFKEAVVVRLDAGEYGDTCIFPSLLPSSEKCKYACVTIYHVAPFSGPSLPRLNP